jgi:GntR family transcriptional repressor for pyruvate dehydrogenase complex
VTRNAAAASAVAHIQELITSRTLLPGDRLPSERELSRTLGVSRSTLREAIRALVVMNVLVSRQGAGTYVSSLEPELLTAPFAFTLGAQPALASHVAEARVLLATACARLAAERIDDEELESIESLARMGTSTPDDGVEPQLQSAIAGATRNPVLLALTGCLGRLASETGAPSSRRSRKGAPTTIVAALRRRDADGAARAVEMHLTHGERRRRQQPSPMRRGSTT